MLVLKPGETEIDGVRCVEGLGALDGKLDLLIVAVAASGSTRSSTRSSKTGSVEAVMLIPGSMGETKKSREPAAALAARINAAHGEPDAVDLPRVRTAWAWCRTRVVRPWFIPLERLPKPQKKPVPTR